MRVAESRIMIFSTDDGWLRAPALALFVSVYWLFGCGGESSHVDDNNLRSDVIDCEAAAAQLQHCCPAGVQVPTCHYSKTVYTCGWPIESEISETVTDMPIPTSVSTPIANASCSDIVANGQCNLTWPAYQPVQPSAADQQEANEEEEDDPDGPCGEWGQP
jgi:hypothetical protein